MEGKLYLDNPFNRYYIQKSLLDEIIYTAQTQKGGTLWKNGLNW